MKAIRNRKQLFDEGQRLEKKGELEEAVAVYRRLVDDDPEDRGTLARLLVVLRRLKNYREELDAVETALAQSARQDKVLQRKWIEAHPGAARLGKAVLLKLGGEDASVYGTDPQVKKWERRREVLEKKLGVKRRTRPAAANAAVRKKGAAEERKEGPADKRKKAAELRREAARQKMEAVEAKKREAAEKRRKEAETRKARKEAEKNRSSLFIVSLRYLVSLDKIDAVMKKHVAFLEKHYSTGQFLVSGRQEPRSGGIILARGKNRDSIEKIVKQDPFVKGGLASVDIVEFKPSKFGKGVKGIE